MNLPGGGQDDPTAGEYVGVTGPPAAEDLTSESLADCPAKKGSVAAGTGDDIQGEGTSSTARPEEDLLVDLHLVALHLADLCLLVVD